MTAVIVDDEQHCIDRIIKLVSDNNIEVEIIGCYNSVDEGFNGISLLKPDFIFLDIHIGKETGFDLLEKFAKIDFEVIFTTAFENHAIQAIKFSAIDYLLKPIDFDDLKESIARLKEKIGSRKFNVSGYEELLQNLLHIKSQNKKITIQTQTETLLINIQDIIRCQSDINYTTLYLKNGKNVVASKTLKDFENLLSPYNFFRVHNSHLINLEYMKSYDKGKGGYVHLIDNSVVEVSVRRKEPFINRLNEL